MGYARPEHSFNHALDFLITVLTRTGPVTALKTAPVSSLMRFWDDLKYIWPFFRTPFGSAKAVDEQDILFVIIVKLTQPGIMNASIDSDIGILRLSTKSSITVLTIECILSPSGSHVSGWKPARTSS